PANDTPDGEKAFPLLDAYLEELQSGGRPDKERLLAEHPELASALECLEALEHLAPATAGPPADPSRALLWQGAPTGTGATPGDAAPAAGSEFGRYQLLEEIGRGGMGVVFKAHQKDLDRPVAIKMILAGHLASAEHVARFDAEARAAAHLHH